MKLLPALGHKTSQKVPYHWQCNVNFLMFKVVPRHFVYVTNGFCVFQVAIADHDGVITCFGMKKGEPVVGIEF